MKRRSMLKGCAALLGVALVAPFRAIAAAWNRAAFEATSVDAALQGLAANKVGPSRDIVLTAPQLAENGAIVQVEVESRLPGTEAIAILADKNPTPLIANFVFHEGAAPFVITRIKLAETTELKAIVKAGGQYYSVARMVEVSKGGCD